MRLKDYSALCFDMDFTLVNYALNNFIPMVYNALATNLVDLGYDKEILDFTAADMRMVRRGIILDKETHCMINISSTGKVLTASRGMKMLTEDQVLETYPKKEWHHFSSFSKSLDEPYGSPFFSFDSYFGTPAIPLVSKIIQKIQAETPDQYVEEQYCNLYKNLMTCFSYNYNPAHFKKNTGYFFPKMKKDISQYILKASPELIAKLKECRASGQKIVVVTASHIDFTELLMSYAYGDDWKDIFDVVSCRARKPGWFSCSRSERPCLRWNGKKVIDDPAMDEVDPGVVHIEGEWTLMNDWIKSSGGEGKVAYIGDSFRSDLVPTKQHTTWDAITVVLEGSPEHSNLSVKQNTNPYLNGAEHSHKKQKLIDNQINLGTFFGTKSSPTLLHDKLVEYSDLVISDVEAFSGMGLNDVLVKDGNKFYDFNPFPCQ